MKKVISLVLSVVLMVTSLTCLMSTGVSADNSLQETQNTYDNLSDFVFTKIEHSTVDYGKDRPGYFTKLSKTSGTTVEGYFSACGATVEEFASGNNAVKFSISSGYSYGYISRIMLYDSTGGTYKRFATKENTSYTLKMRYNAVNTNGRVMSLKLFNSSDGDLVAYRDLQTSDKLSNIGDIVNITQNTDGWKDVTMTFSTGAGEYAALCIGLTDSVASGINEQVEVWIDDVEVYENTEMTVHNYNGNGTDGKISACSITTISDIIIPAVNGFKFEGIYSDSEYQNMLSSSAIVTEYTELYFKWVKIGAGQSYAGFENYTELLSGMSYNPNVVTIQSDDTYVGGKALKAKLAANGVTAFEVRDENIIEIKANSQYNVAFMYKSDKDIKIGFGLGKSGNVSGSSYTVINEDFSKSENWKSGNLVLTADRGTADNFALSMLISATEAAEVLIDDILITDLSVADCYTAMQQPPVESIVDFPKLTVFENSAKTEDYEVWDGKSSTEPTKETESENTYLITNGAELYYVIKNGGGAGNTYKLTKDIYLNDINKVNWRTGDVESGYTVRVWNTTDEDYFEGNIDGNGHVIYGIYRTVNPAYIGSGYAGAGLITRVRLEKQVNIVNLGIDNSYIMGWNGVSAFVGNAGSISGGDNPYYDNNVNTDKYAKLRFDQCYVGENVTLTGNHVGAFIGNIRGCKADITNCYSLAEYIVSGTACGYGIVGGVHWDQYIDIKNVFTDTSISTILAPRDGYGDKAFFQNTYATENTKNNATQLTIDNMKGEDVLKNSEKMPNLNSNDVFVASTPDMSDCFMYLPEGTIFTDIYSADYYDSFFNKLDVTDVIKGNVMQCGAYVNFKVVPKEESILVKNSLYSFAKLLTKAEIEATLKDYSVNCTNYNELNSKIASQQLDDYIKSSKESNVNYIFITDLHYCGTFSGTPSYTNSSSWATWQAEAVYEQVKRVTERANNDDNIDFVVIGGDIITNSWAINNGNLNLTHKQTAIRWLKEVLAPLKECKKPVFILPGNHDDNSYATFEMDAILSDKDWNDNIIDEFVDENIVQDKNDANSKYYYYDLTAKKTRVVCLDAVDYDHKYNADGTITELAIRNENATEDVEKYWSGRTWWGYSAEQMKWLANDALTAGDGWNYIFVSHMGIDEQTNGSSEVMYSEELRGIIGAYQNKIGYKNPALDIDVDYSKTNGKILSYQFGHQHLELELYSEDIDLWQICTSTANGSQQGTSTNGATNKTYNWKIFDRKPLSDSEACIDFMSVSESGINKLSIGVGDNVKLLYPNNLTGDINFDGTTDIRDLVCIKKVFAGVNRLNTAADIDKNSKLEATDLAELRKVLLKK